MSQAANEFLHNVKFAAQQQTEDYAPFVYGHIASYDPLTHRVRLILPSIRNEDGTPVLTSWMPLGSMGGAGWGIQIAPMGGATQQNPTQGELCIVQRLDRTQGIQVCASMIWNQVNQPPFTTLQPGEIGLQSQSGSSLKMTNDKNVTVTSGAKLNMTVTGDINITTQGKTTVTSTGDLGITTQGSTTINSTGNCTLNSSGNLTLAALGSLAITATSAAIGAVGGTVHKLVTDAFEALFNAHVHSGVPGGDTGPPTVAMTSAQLTTIMSAQ
jgi:phage gp45-like